MLHRGYNCAESETKKMSATHQFLVSLQGDQRFVELLLVVVHFVRFTAAEARFAPAVRGQARVRGRPRTAAHVAAVAVFVVGRLVCLILEGQRCLWDGHSRRSTLQTHNEIPFLVANGVY